MSNTKFDDIASLDSSRRDWKIRVRVVRSWRGYTKQGQPFNNFNIIIIDKQETKIQAFIPAKCNDILENKLKLGPVCSITNFDVEMYKTEDRFRTVTHEYRLIFGEDTKVKQLDDKEAKLPDDTFDFYDHEDLLQIANDNVYLTDVVGIIRNRETVKLNQVVNRLSQTQTQTQLKFSITDGSTAKRVYDELQKPLDEPVIIILAAAKVGKWKEEVDLSHVAATHFYINHDHHTVNRIRKKLQDPVFSQSIETTRKDNELKLHTIAQLKKLGVEAVKTDVICHVVVKYVDDKANWFLRVCTKCKQKLSEEGTLYKCVNCNRIIPHPEKRFEVSIVGTDQTGGIEIKLNDRQVRTLLGRRAQQLYDEQNGSIAHPQIIKGMQNKEITVQLSIKEANFGKTDAPYFATNTCFGFYMPGKAKDKVTNSATTTSNKHECSNSTYHLDGISQLNVDSETS